MDQHPFFAYLSRMRYINRWGLMRNTFQENIQEHSHMVAVLAHALAVIRRDVFGREADPGLAVMAALYHDAPEILTGDLPTPIKYYDPEIRDAYRKVEAYSAGKLLAMLPEQLRQLPARARRPPERLLREERLRKARPALCRRLRLRALPAARGRQQNVTGTFQPARIPRLLFPQRPATRTRRVRLRLPVRPPSSPIRWKARTATRRSSVSWMTTRLFTRRRSPTNCISGSRWMKMRRYT